MNPETDWNALLNQYATVATFDNRGALTESDPNWRLTPNDRAFLAALQIDPR